MGRRVFALSLSFFSHSVQSEINIIESFHEEVSGNPFRIAKSHLNRRITEINTFEDIPELCGDIFPKPPVKRRERENGFVDHHFRSSLRSSDAGQNEE